MVNVSLYLSSAVKVGHITCDNASNNLTMMKELAARLNTSTGKRPQDISLEEAENQVRLSHFFNSFTSNYSCSQTQLSCTCN